MDKIKIKGLEVFAHHGVYKEENILGQKFIVDCEMGLDTRQAGIDDNLKCSVDYGAVCTLINNVMREENYKLIEAAAEKLASSILLKFEDIKEVKLELKKPWAPVLMPMDTVSVEIFRKKHTAYLGLGSNLGNKESYLDFAIDELNNDYYTKVTKVSDFIETEPYGEVEQDNFLNGCLEIETLRSPVELLALANQIESMAGRKRTIHWGPRTLDIDILMYDDMVYDDDQLHIPHIELHKREFVLKPLCSIAGSKRHPMLHKTILELYEELEK
jgi:dihydroneopterin aldolase/2-amino-4-hydroxy-6-hydroxymethyldihydropteridine diphosphokinase